MTPIEKAIREFCGHHADWWPSTTQVQEMLVLAQPCPTCEALARTVMLDQTSHDTKRRWIGLTDEEIGMPTEPIQPHEAIMFARVIEALIKGKNT